MVWTILNALRRAVKGMAGFPLLVKGGGDFLEKGQDFVSERKDDNGNRERDPRSDQGVFDRGGAGFITRPNGDSTVHG